MKPYFQSEGIVVYHGSCHGIGEWLHADVMITDPPYGMAYQSGWKESSNVANDATTEARDTALRQWGDKPALVFGRWSVPRPAATRTVLYWDKGDWPGMGDLSLPWGPSTEEIYVLGSGFVGKREGQIIPCHKRATDGFHPTEKPVALIGTLMMKCPPGIIADPFMGSGTTLVAAKLAGRAAVGVEIEEKYCEVAARRLSQGVLAFDASPSTREAK